MTEAAAAKDLSDAASRARVGSTARELGDVLRDRDPRRSLAVFDLGIHRLEETHNRLESRRDRAVLLAKSSYPLRRLRRASEARSPHRCVVRHPQRHQGLSGGADHPRQQRLHRPHRARRSRSRIGRPAPRPRNLPATARQVLATNPDVFNDLRDAPKLSRIYTALALLYRRTGDAASARVLTARRVELWRSWQQKLPQNPFVRRQLEAALLPPPPDSRT